MRLRIPKIGDQQKRLTIPDKIQLLCVGYVGIWTISPPLFIEAEYRLIAVAAFSIWVAIELLKRPRYLLAPASPFFAAIVFSVYSALVIYGTDGLTGLVQRAQFYISISFLVFFQSYVRKGFAQLRILFWCSLLVFPIWTLTTLNALQRFPGAARALTRSGEFEDQLVRQGVGGYGLVYSAVFMIPLLLLMVKLPGVRSKLLRVLAIGNLVLIYLLVIEAGFTIALVLALVGTVLTTMIKVLDRAAVFRSGAVLLILLVMFIFFGDSFLSGINAVSSGTLFEHKVSDTIDSVEADSATGTVEDRIERYSRSFRSVAAHPFIGTIDRRGVGKHSALLDTGARFGIFVGILFAYLMMYVPVSLVRNHKETGAFGGSLAVTGMAFLLLALNTIPAGFGFVIFVLFPAVMSFFYSGSPGRTQNREHLILSQSAHRRMK